MVKNLVLLSFLMFLVLNISSYGKEKILKGKIIKILDNVVIVDVKGEGCSGKREYIIEDDLADKLQQGKEITFKANIKRNCNGNIIEVIEEE